MAAIIRLKRKACDEPAEGLVIALKKSKCEQSDTNKVLFKFAATLSSEKESVRDHIQAALSKDKSSNQRKWKNPKDTAIDEKKISRLREKLQAEHKSANEKKKLDYLNNKRLILAEEFEDSLSKEAEIRPLFHLYDIIEENEDVKRQNEETESMITCNGERLVREKVGDYVFDVYIADGHIDRTFIDETVSVRPCSWTADDIYLGDSDSSEECYEDEDDSNDENNWRNDYPDDDSKSEKDSSDSETSSYDGDCNGDPLDETVSRAFNDFDIGDEYDEDDSRIFREMKDEYDSDDEDED